MFRLDRSASAGGTSLRGETKLPPAFLVERFGKHDGGDGARSSGGWEFVGDSGAVFTVYEWRCTTLSNGRGSGSPTVREFWRLWEPVRFHIGGHDDADWQGFRRWLRAEYRKFVKARESEAEHRTARSASKGARMDEERFWKLVAKACLSNPLDSEEWDTRLQTALEKLRPDEIVEWGQIFNRLAARAYTVDLWGAAYLINGGASDDGFYYFRCWLIGMGREVYEAAVDDPDSLAVAVVPGIDAEAEIYAAAHQAWMAVTGRPDTDPYPARNEQAELRGEDWDFDDDEQVRRRFPRLAALYLE